MKYICREKQHNTTVRSTLTLLCSIPAQMDVLVDKAPLKRRESTPACLVELARVRADMRTGAGSGVNRIGVVGPLVDKLVLFLPVSRTVVATLHIQHTKFACHACAVRSHLPCLLIWPAFDSGVEQVWMMLSTKVRFDHSPCR